MNEIEFQTWRIVRWDDETSVPVQVCRRDPVAARRTLRSRRRR